MLGSGVDAQAAQLDVARAVGREHSAHGPLDQPFGMFVGDLARGLHFQTAGIVAMTVIELLLPLVAAELNLVSVDDDNVIAIVDMGSPRRLVLARKRPGDPHRERAKALA